MSVVLAKNDRGTGVMNVIKGNFGDKKEVSKVFECITDTENLEVYDKAFCIVKSKDTLVVSTNMDNEELYFLLDRIKMSILTQGEYEI